MKRILTAAILIPAIVALVLWGPTYLIAVVVLLIAELGMWEFFRIAEGCGFAPMRVPGYLLAGMITCSSLVARVSFGFWFITLLVVAAIVPLTVGLFSRRPLQQYFGGVAATLLGEVYVSVPLAMLVMMLSPGSTVRKFILLGLALVWVGDTAAYFVGKAWGTHKLAPHVSPGKTWEGSIASIVFAVIAGVVLNRFLQVLGDGQAAILAIPVNIAAQIGDLAESALKRNAGIKDSSNLVPGHGGVLDRIDALLFAAPVLWYYWVVTH